jgi:hypothetical protein
MRRCQPTASHRRLSMSGRSQERRDQLGPRPVIRRVLLAWLRQADPQRLPADGQPHRSRGSGAGRADQDRAALGGRTQGARGVRPSGARQPGARPPSRPAATRDRASTRRLRGDVSGARRPRHTNRRARRDHPRRQAAAGATARGGGPALLRRPVGRRDRRRDRSVAGQRQDPYEPRARALAPTTPSGC